MSAVFQRNHACIWNCLRDVLSRTSGDEVVIAVDDQRRDLEPLELGEQVILGLDHVSFMSRSSTAKAIAASAAYQEGRSLPD